MHKPIIILARPKGKASNKLKELMNSPEFIQRNLRYKGEFQKKFQERFHREQQEKDDMIKQELHRKQEQEKKYVAPAQTAELKAAEVHACVLNSVNDLMTALPGNGVRKNSLKMAIYSVIEKALGSPYDATNLAQWKSLAVNGLTNAIESLTPGSVDRCCIPGLTAKIVQVIETLCGEKYGIETTETPTQKSQEIEMNNSMQHITVTPTLVVPDENGYLPPLGGENAAHVITIDQGGLYPESALQSPAIPVNQTVTLKEENIMNATTATIDTVNSTVAAAQNTNLSVDERIKNIAASIGANAAKVAFASSNALEQKKSLLSRIPVKKIALWGAAAAATAGAGFYAWKAFKGGASVADVTDSIEGVGDAVAAFMKK